MNNNNSTHTHDTTNNKTSDNNHTHNNTNNKRII